MFRVVVLLSLFALIGAKQTCKPNQTANQTVNQYPSQYKLNSYDLRTLKNTKNTFCFSLLNATFENIANRKGCEMGCYQCSSRCKLLYGMQWSCCDGPYCCCYDTFTPCKRTGFLSTQNYC